MGRFRLPHMEPKSRSPHGERGLKFDSVMSATGGRNGRSPHGERGLKSEDMFGIGGQSGVALLMESVD